jgi:hypothetical protein
MANRLCALRRPQCRCDQGQGGVGRIVQRPVLMESRCSDEELFISSHDISKTSRSETNLDDSSCCLLSANDRISQAGCTKPCNQYTIDKQARSNVEIGRRRWSTSNYPEAAEPHRSTRSPLSRRQPSLFMHMRYNFPEFIIYRYRPSIIALTSTPSAVP